MISISKNKKVLILKYNYEVLFYYLYCSYYYFVNMFQKSYRINIQKLKYYESIVQYLNLMTQNINWICEKNIVNV